MFYLCVKCCLILFGFAEIFEKLACIQQKGGGGGGISNFLPYMSFHRGVWYFGQASC